MEKRCKGNARCVWVSLSTLVVISAFFFLLKSPLLEPEITGMAISGQAELPDIVIDFSEEIGIIREDFYGVNDEYLVLSNTSYSYLDSDCDDIKDTPIDISLNRELFSDSNMKYVRIWAWLHHISIEENSYNQTVIGWLMDEAEYAHSQGYRILLRTDVMPSWLQNKSSAYCDETDEDSCPPTNNTKFGVIIDYIINNLTQVIPEEDVDVEILNEPWNNTWLNKGTKNERVTIYADIFKTTRDIIKSNHPNVSVGWTGTYDLSGIYFYRIEGLISNLTNNTDFVYLHAYPYDYTTTNTLYDNLKNLSDTFYIYGVNPKPRMGFSEWNVWSGTYKYAPNRYSTEIASAYQSVLNYNPTDVSLIFFEFSKFESYHDCTNLYPEYPLKFPMFNELDNELTPPYNVTKNFATYHSPGSVVVNSSSTDKIKAVASKKEKYYITIINSGENTSVKIKVEDGVDFFKDLETGDIYTLDNGIIDISLLEYEIKYLVSFDPSEPPLETPSPLGGGYVSLPSIINESNLTNNETEEKSNREIEEINTIESTEETSLQNESPYSSSIAGTGNVILEDKKGFSKGALIIFLAAIITISLTILYLILKKRYNRFVTTQKFV